MRPEDWYPRAGMRFVIPPLGDDEPEGLFEVDHLNVLCRCEDCPCYLGAIDEQWAGQFSLAELRMFDFAPDNTVTEPDRREPIKGKTGFFHLATAGEPIQGALL